MLALQDRTAELAQCHYYYGVLRTAAPVAGRALLDHPPHLLLSALLFQPEGGNWVSK